MKSCLKILMLEDSADDAELIQRLLKKEKMECEFFLAMDKTNFIKALEEFAPEIILSDHSIPQFNSSEALTIAREKLPGIPFIMVTGAVSEEFAAGIIKQGADDYILKDRMARLPAAIRAAILQKEHLNEINNYKYALDKSAIVAITNEKGIILYANENLCIISKYHLKELIGRDHRIMNSGFHPASYIKDLWVTITNGNSWTGEFCNRAKDGSIYWVNTHITPFLNGDGEPYQYLAITQDITKRKKAEEQLRLSEIRLKEAQAIAHIANWEIDLVKNIHIWSDELYRILNLNNVEIQPSTDILLSLMRSDGAYDAAKLLTEALQHFNNAKTDFRFRLPDGNKRYGHIEWRFDFDGTGKPYRIFGILQDITERKEAEENVKLLEEKILEEKVLQQKKIAQAVLRGQEKERNFIGLELHDNVNQILAGSKLYLGAAGRKDERLKELIKYPIKLIELSIEEIRQLCHKLIPPQKSINFKGQLQDLLYTLGENTGVTTSLTYDVGDNLLPDDLELNIYRIIQETLNNASKYSEAQHIEVSLIAKEGVISVIVADNGKGFNTKRKYQGIGLSNITYRAECFSGTVSLKSSSGKGCKVLVKIPY